MVAKMMMAIASENTRKPSSEAQALKKQSQVTIVFIPFVFETSPPDNLEPALGFFQYR